MKKKILLIDESLTVQKVVALTLDKNRYALTFAKSRAEVTKLLLENPPDLILLSDQVGEFNAASFPKEMETWLGGVREAAPVILITAQDIKEQRHYAGVLRKPFSPQALQDLVQEWVKPETDSAGDLEDERLQKIFNDTFADESTLVRETFRAEVEAEEPTGFKEVRGRGATDPMSTSLWEINPPTPKGAAESDGWSKRTTAEVAKSSPKGSEHVSDADLEKFLSSQRIDEVVDRVLSRVVPPIVEKLVNERLDKLLKEQEQFLELKS